MLKKIITLSIISGLLSTLAFVVYTMTFFSFIADFSEAINIISLGSQTTAVLLIAGFLFFGMRKIIKNEKIVDFLFNLLLTLVSVGCVFYVFKADDPQFTNEDAQFMAEYYYKSFVIPMVFFPALSWLTLKPLFKI